MIHDGKVVVLCDVLGDSFLAEFDLADGREIWRTPRHDVPTWGTPAVAKAGDRTEILVNGWHQTGAYDFADGKEIWHLDGGGDIPVPTPIVASSLAYFTSAHGSRRPMRAVRLDARGDLTATGAGAANAGVAWQQENKGNYMQTPIVVGNFLYGCVDNGIVTCFDAKLGAIRYSERLGNGSEGFTASPVSDGPGLPRIQMCSDQDILAVCFSARDLCHYIINLYMLANAIPEAEFDLNGPPLKQTFDQKCVFLAKIASRKICYASSQARIAVHVNCIVRGANAENEA